MEIVYKQESYAIVGACFEVYNTMGCGFVEAVYQECLEIEFARQGILFRPQAELSLSYKGQILRKSFIPDFLCFDRILVEIKAVRAIEDWHRSQLHNYLKVTGHRLGLLVNFGNDPKLESERIVK
jgi:GxxExxY protein